MSENPLFARRRFLLGGTAIGAGVLLSSCTSNATPGGEGNNQAIAQGGGDNAEPGEEVNIGFSAPSADHGWMAAMTRNAQAQADAYSDVVFNATEGTNDVNQQIAQVETLITSGVDVLIILPHDGAALTSVGQQAMDAGIPVINVDRVFDSPLAYRMWIGGDNYRMGVNAGNYIGERLKEEGVDDPVIAEVAGIDSLPLTQDRSQGFADALERHGFSVTNRVAAEFTVESGESETSNLLQAAPRIHALWNHDDDQGIGVLAAIDNAGRNNPDELFVVGGAGSSNMMTFIEDPESVVAATVLYSPSMCSSAVSMARLLGQAKGMADLAEHEIPASLTTYSAVVTADNVADYRDVGFES